MPAVTICVPMKSGQSAALLVDDLTKFAISTDTAACLCGAPKSILYDRHKGYLFVQVEMSEATQDYVSKVFGNKPYKDLDLKALIDLFPKP